MQNREPYPAALVARSGRFTLDRARIAVRGHVPPELAGQVEDRLEDESIAILGASPADAASLGADALPVYVLGSGGVAFVATGRATVRFRTGVDANAQADALRDAGYRIVNVPPYAPHMAWVEALSGDVTAALAGLDRLARLRDVDRVEPQMLSRGERR